MGTLSHIENGKKVYDGPIFDCDSHIYELNYDFMKDYLPKALQAEYLVSRKNGNQGFGLYVGDRKVENTECDPDGKVPPPGKLKEWLRAMKEGQGQVAGWVKPTPDMYDRDARMKKLDEFGVDYTMLFIGEFVATFGWYPQDKTGVACMNAYNRYMNDHWGLAHKNRLFSTGLLTLWDLEASTAEAKWLVKNGAKVVCMPLGPANNKSPADPYYDPIWNVLNEAKVTVAFHVSEANFMHPLIYAFGEKPLQSRRIGQTAWQWQFCYSAIPLQMTIANIIYNNFFARFPDIRIASVENGASWLPAFLEGMDKSRGMAKNGYWPNGQLKERPSNIFKKYCATVAYPEDDVKSMVERLGGTAGILMGSDYPHAEGVAEPRAFYTEALTGLPDAQVREIMYDNAKALVRI
ncbi:MAG: amidohydrolase [Rhodospirillaceae bacterium]|nr:MAG: amidohydrolase [Rhodospirillaceae bacterium]